MDLSGLSRMQEIYRPILAKCEFCIVLSPELTLTYNRHGPHLLSAACSSQRLGRPSSNVL